MSDAIGWLLELVFKVIFEWMCDFKKRPIISSIVLISIIAILGYGIWSIAQ